MTSRNTISAARQLVTSGALAVVLEHKIAEEVAVLLTCDPEGEMRPRRSLTRIQLLNELADYVKELAQEKADS